MHFGGLRRGVATGAQGDGVDEKGGEVVASGAPVPPHHRCGVAGIHSVARSVNELERRARCRFSDPVDPQRLRQGRFAGLETRGVHHGLRR